MDQLMQPTPLGTSSGVIGYNDLNSLRKALEAGYGTDVAGLTGGGALRVQSLDHTLQSLLATEQSFKLFNALNKSDVGATVDEWTEATDQGGFLGSTVNSETGALIAAQGTYARRTGLVKYLMTQCQVSFVQTLQNAIVEAEAAENQMGTLRLLRDAEFLCFEGDSSVIPTQWDGIGPQLISLNSSDHVLDAEGLSLASINAIVQASATIGNIGNFGVPTDLYVSPLVGADLDANLDPAYRVPLANGQETKRGTPVRGIVTSEGDIALHRDIYIRDQGMQSPFELAHAAVASANSAMVCASVPTGVTANDAASKFGAGHAGNYYYAVAGYSQAGQSAVAKSAQIAIAAGEKCTLTITASSGATETGYVIYRSRKNGTNATADFREVCRVAKGGATTTWVDYNREVPGTSKAYLLNMNPGYTAITWRKMLPLTRFQLFATAANGAVLPWALLMFGYLRISKRRQHVMIRNILPSASPWKPFG